MYTPLTFKEATKFHVYRGYEAFLEAMDELIFLHFNGDKAVIPEEKVQEIRNQFQVLPGIEWFYSQVGWEVERVGGYYLFTKQSMFR